MQFNDCLWSRYCGLESYWIMYKCYSLGLVLLLHRKLLFRSRRLWSEAHFLGRVKPKHSATECHPLGFWEAAQQTWIAWECCNGRSHPIPCLTTQFESSRDAWETLSTGTESSHIAKDHRWVLYMEILWLWMSFSQVFLFVCLFNLQLHLFVCL